MKSKTVKIWAWDNGGETFDRYTIAIDGIQYVDDQPYVMILGASEHPFHPQGFGQHCNEVPSEEFKVSKLSHWGKRIGWYELPDDVRTFVIQQLIPEPIMGE